MMPSLSQPWCPSRRSLMLAGMVITACGLAASIDAADAVQRPASDPWDQTVIDTVFAPLDGHEELHGRVSWGIKQTTVGPEGIVLLELEQASRGGALASAGCFPGDVIVAVDAVPMRTSEDLVSAIRRSRPYTPVNVLISQAGKRSLMTVVPSGHLRLAPRERRPVVTVPGVAPPAAAPDHSGDTLACINVLEAVAIDRTSGAVEVVGRFDPKYRTGPIAYLDLLKTAINSTAPRLNLLPDSVWSEKRPAAKECGDVKVLLALPAAEAERQQLLRAIPAALGISGEDYALLHNYAWFDREKTLPPPPAVARVTVTFLRHLGWDDVATAYERLGSNTADAFSAVLVALDREDALRSILDSPGLDGKQKHNALANRACIAIMERLGLPAAQARHLASLTEDGDEDVRPMLDKMYQDLPVSARDVRGRQPMRMALTAVNVGDAATRVFHDYQLPLPVRIETIDVDRTSLLARIMYAADYVGKLTMVRSDLFDSIPGHESIYQYTGRKLASLDKRQRALVDAIRSSAYWFAPTRVELRISPDRSLVSFGESRVEVRTKVDEFRDPSQQLTVADAALLQTFNQEWCDQFTNNYDRYSQVLPELHALREAAKVVALARWAREQGTKLNLEGVRQEKWSPPDVIMGFSRSGTIVIKDIAAGLYEDVNAAAAVTQYGTTGGVSFASPESWIVLEEGGDTPGHTVERSGKP